MKTQHIESSIPSPRSCANTGTQINSRRVTKKNNRARIWENILLASAFTWLPICPSVCLSNSEQHTKIFHFLEERVHQLWKLFQITQSLHLSMYCKTYSYVHWYQYKSLKISNYEFPYSRISQDTLCSLPDRDHGPFEYREPSN